MKYDENNAMDKLAAFSEVAYALNTIIATATHQSNFGPHIHYPKPKDDAPELTEQEIQQSIEDALSACNNGQIMVIPPSVCDKAREALISCIECIEGTLLPYKNLAIARRELAAMKDK